MPTKVACIVTS